MFTTIILSKKYIIEKLLHYPQASTMQKNNNKKIENIYYSELEIQ